MARKIFTGLLIILVLVIVGFLLAGVFKSDYSGTVSVLVKAPASKTFAYFNNTDYMGKWMPGFKSLTNVSGAKNEVGSKWKIVFDENGRDLVINETVTAFEQDKHFAFDMNDEFADFHVDIKFEETNGHTTITQISTGKGKGVIARSMIAIMSGKIQQQNVDMYNKLKLLIENE